MKNKIDLYFHCRKCDEENKDRRQSMREFSRIGAGWTKKGFQVWCERHNCNIMSLDFRGQKIGIDTEGVDASEQNHS
jgi:hypothetical protein